MGVGDTRAENGGELGTGYSMNTGREQRRKTEDLLTVSQSAGTGEEYHASPGDTKKTTSGGG